MNFFKNKITQIVSWIVLCIAITILIIGGVTQEQIAGVLVAVVAVISAVGALVALICSLIKNKNK